MFNELAPGIFSVDSRFVDGKNGIVIGLKMRKMKRLRWNLISILKLFSDGDSPK